MASQLTGVEKAAILLISLGEQTAGQVLKELTDEEIYKITQTISSIHHIPEADRISVLEEYKRMSETQAGIAVRGHEFAKKTIHASGDGKRAEFLMRKLRGISDERPLKAISTMSPTMVAGILDREHPQTIAVILSTQTPEHAAAIIAEISQADKADIMYRVATLDKVSPIIIKQIEDALSYEIGIEGDGIDHEEIGGLQKAVDIFGSMKDNLDNDILDNIENIDIEMADDIRNLMFVFEDFIRLDDRSIQMILREVNNESLTTALKTASEELKEKIFKNMSTRAADMLRDDLDAMGPVRLSDVEAMQMSIARVAMKMEEEGKIILSRGGDGNELV